MEITSFSSESTTELAKAMLKVQTQLAPATKDATNPFTRSRYASLNSVLASCGPVLIRNGIWLTQLPVPAESGFIGLLTKLTHAESGQYQASLTVLPLSKPDCQGAGSAITYARRYALTAMLGMTTEDDDGEGACKASQARAHEMAPVQPQADTAAPDLPNVQYETIKGRDGHEYQLATGDTHPVRDMLRSMGFRWDAGRKAWWRPAV